MIQSAEELRARSEVYEFLSHAYSAEGTSLKEYRSSAWHRAFNVLELPLLSRELETIVAYLRTSTEPLELSVEYTRLFRGPVKAEVYPYESMHVDGEVMGASALDVVGHYREAGVEVSAEFRDLPDHICVEVDFMRHLCVLELEALGAGNTAEAAQIRLMGKSFLIPYCIQDDGYI